MTNEYDDNGEYEDWPSKKKQRKYKRWQKVSTSNFRCGNCLSMVFNETAIGTVQRNHCNTCLWSKHVDTKPGNRDSDCHSRMEPLALTFKHAGVDKYGKERVGDVMLVHMCTGCETPNINRIAGDDSCSKIMDTFNKSLSLDDAKIDIIETHGIKILREEDRQHLEIALFGKPLEQN